MWQVEVWPLLAIWTVSSAWSWLIRQQKSSVFFTYDCSIAYSQKNPPVMTAGSAVSWFVASPSLWFMWNCFVCQKARKDCLLNIAVLSFVKNKILIFFACWMWQIVVYLFSRFSQYKWLSIPVSSTCPACLLRFNILSTRIKIYMNPQFRVNCTVLSKKCNIIRLPTE